MPLPIAWWLAIVLWAMALVALVVMVRGVWGDRAKGRRRCAGCWYDLRDVATPRADAPVVCSECGKRMESEKQLLRTRRRWWVVVVSGLLAIAAGVLPRVLADGWWGLVPTRAVVMMMPFMDEGGTGTNRVRPAYDELRRRMGMGRGPVRLSIDEHLDVFEAFVQGVPGARPVSPRWVEHFEGPMHDWQGAYSGLMRIASSEGQRRRLEEILDATTRFPWKLVDVSTREIWPAGVSVVLEPEIRVHWPQGTGMLASVRYQGEELKRDERGFRLPPTARGAVKLDVAVTLDWANGRAVEGGTQHMQVDIRVDGSAADSTRPVVARRLDWMVSKLAFVKVDTVLPDLSAVGLGLRPQASGRGFDGVVVAGLAHVMVDGLVVMSLPACATISAQGHASWKHSAEQADVAFVKAMRTMPERWTARFVSDAELALSAIQATSRWEGAVEIPVVFDADLSAMIRGRVLPADDVELDGEP